MEKNNYEMLLSDVLNEIKIARINAVSETVKVMTNLYFKIGEIIVSKQKEFGWGSSIVRDSIRYFSGGDCKCSLSS